MAGSTITIFRKDDKLVVVREPILPTWQEKNCGCFVLILVAVSAFIVMGIGFFNSGNEDLFYTFLIVVGIVSLIIAILVVRDRFRNRRKPVHPPDYDHEILTFDPNKFVLQHRGMVNSFSYRLDAKPVLRHSPYSEHIGIIIPCKPLDDRVPDTFDGGYYHMEWLDSNDAEQILVHLKEHLESIAFAQP